MAKKEMSVCDLCGRPGPEMNHSVTIDTKEYKEVCSICIQKFDTFIKRLAAPYPYKKKEQPAESAPKAVDANIPDPLKTEAPKAISKPFGKK